MESNEHELRGRVDRLEQELDELYKSLKKLEETIYSLNTTIALLELTIKSLKSDAEGKADFNGKVTFLIVGGVISTAVAFVLKGGLVLQ